ncbi:hypothetical protein FOXB_09879 [Fusarium oxysporum f. sp. conglutinans Fo5176]|uniref:Uncharacterized protein n=2 Tax=Fusarium oxysporum f. sp. conglutinans TaxID=100902 RepID=F9FTZ8_FUSOF|nr:hypothetical protein FOXB_09879 [Fusarium oxysporum f. sp. conglutinans Fo5176]
MTELQELDLSLKGWHQEQEKNLCELLIRTRKWDMLKSLKISASPEIVCAVLSRCVPKIPEAVNLDGEYGTRTYIELARRCSSFRSQHSLKKLNISPNLHGPLLDEQIILGVKTHFEGLTCLNIQGRSDELWDSWWTTTVSLLASIVSISFPVNLMILSTSLRLTKTTNIANPDVFVPGNDNVVPTRDSSGLLVKRIRDQKRNIQPLHNRINGLRELSLLPNEGTTQDRVFYYKEFTIGAAGPQAKKRRTKSNTNIVNACNDYISIHVDDSLDLIKTSDMFKQT